MRAEEYLTILTDQIRCKMARGAVREEIRCHIEDQTAAFLSEGMEQAEAEEAAVREMGDPVETGNELNRIHRPRMAWGMIGLIAVLSLAGYLIQNFMQEKWIAAGEGAWSSPYSFVYILAGLAVMMAACFADYTRIAGRARELLILLYLFLAVSPAVLGTSINGSVSWIYLPLTGGTINLSYVQLITVPVYAAVLYRYSHGMAAQYHPGGSAPADLSCGAGSGGVEEVVQSTEKAGPGRHCRLCRRDACSGWDIDLAVWRRLPEGEAESCAGSCRI